MKITANGSTTEEIFEGGNIGFYAQVGGGSGFSGGSLQMQANFEGSVWFDIGSPFTGANYNSDILPPCKLRFTLTGGGAGINIDCGWRAMPPRV